MGKVFKSHAHNFCRILLYYHFRYLYECDCWSSGIIMYLLLAGYPPFYTQNDDQGELFDQILEAKVPLTEDYLPEVSWSAKLILKKLLMRKPRDRMKARELMADKWTKDPGRITQLDENEAELLLEHLQQQPDLPQVSSLSINRRFSNPDLANGLKPGQKAVFQSLRANTQLHQQYKKVFSSVPHQTSRQSSLSDNEVYQESDSEDGQVENGVSDFIFYRPTQ